MNLARKVVLSLLMCSLLSVAALAKDRGGDKKKKHQDIPEGGSSLVYVSLAAVACLGAVTLKSRAQEIAKNQA